ncbi:MAG: hypothetical protein H7X80_05375 [bacterium]|nr:hypothetical protein [Candidatus Kapabacteria bacterium]
MLIALASCILLSGCPVPITHYSDAGTFARALFRIARERDEDEWSTMLTKARRDQGHAYFHPHFEKYHKLIMELEEGPLGGDLTKASFRIQDGALEFEYESKWATIFRVEMEDGGWKINQD